MLKTSDYYFHYILNKLVMIPDKNDDMLGDISANRLWVVHIIELPKFQKSNLLIRLDIFVMNNVIKTQVTVWFMNSDINRLTKTNIESKTLQNFYQELRKPNKERIVSSLEGYVIENM